jgi:hypothetical protein
VILAKSFRPISLPSFLLKKDEIIIDRFVRDLFREAQHAYQENRSCETALHNLVSRFEVALPLVHFWTLKEHLTLLLLTRNELPKTQGGASTWEALLL